MNYYHHGYPIMTSLQFNTRQMLLVNLIVTCALAITTAFVESSDVSLHTKRIFEEHDEVVNLPSTSPPQRSSECGCPNEPILRRHHFNKCLHHKKLNLSNCAIPLIQIERNAFANLSVTAVYLDGNDLTSLPSDVFCNTKIKLFYVQNNPRFTVRPKQTFSCGKFLNYLDLTGTYFEYTGENVLYSLRNLRCVNVTGQPGCEAMKADLQSSINVICDNSSDKVKYSCNDTFETKPPPQLSSETGHFGFTNTISFNSDPITPYSNDVEGKHEPQTSDTAIKNSNDIEYDISTPKSIWPIHHDEEDNATVYDYDGSSPGPLKEYDGTEETDVPISHILYGVLGFILIFLSFLVVLHLKSVIQFIRNLRMNLSV